MKEPRRELGCMLVKVPLGLSRLNPQQDGKADGAHKEATSSDKSSREPSPACYVLHQCA